MAARIEGEPRIVDEIFSGNVGKPGSHGATEWAIAWTLGDGFLNSYCNTIPTGRRRHARSRACATPCSAASAPTPSSPATSAPASSPSDDVLAHCNAMLSVFVREPEFVGQTKDKLSSPEATTIVDNALRDAFDHWLAASPNQATKLLDWTIERAEERLRRRKEKEIDRQSATRKLRLPGKLADCTQSAAQGAEIFIVEGDSAGGSAKQARQRASQAVLPLRGKVLNVAGATARRWRQNQQIADLIQALGCGTRDRYRGDDLRYDKIILMTDADVDGAHIASLLMTFFFQEMPRLIDEGHLYLALPPLYRMTQGAKTALRHGRRPQGRADDDRVHRQGQGRHHPLQGPRRDALRAPARDHDGPEDAHAASGPVVRRPRRHQGLGRPADGQQARSSASSSSRRMPRS